MSDEELFKKVMSHEFYSGTMFDARELAHECACRMDELRRDLAACAAGPWRTDVENAPRDGSEVLLAWANNGNVYTETLCWNEIDEVWRNEDEGVLIIPPFAFATINPPQVTP